MKIMMTVTMMIKIRDEHTFYQGLVLPHGTEIQGEPSSWQCRSQTILSLQFSCIQEVELPAKVRSFLNPHVLKQNQRTNNDKY